MNSISGRVVVKETGLGIPDLLVVMNTINSVVAPVASPIVAAAVSTGAAASASTDRLGSRLTDAQGAFELTYDDVQFQVRDKAETRPALQLVVLGPEEPGLTPAARTLYTAQEIRQSAGRTEQYLIRIPTDALQKAGIPLPTDAAAAKDAPALTAGRMQQAVDYRVAVDTQTRTIAAAQVTAARASAQQSDTLIQTRLTESLLGYTADEAAKLNIVMPGVKPDTTVFKTYNDRIANHVNATPVAGYLVLTADEAKKFQDAQGHYRTNIPAAEVEPYLYRVDADAKRTVTIIRVDPMATCGKPATLSDATSGGNGTTGSGGTTGGGATPVDAPLTTQDLPKFLGRLIGPIVSPEENLAAASGRPTPGDVDQSVRNLQLGAGPADVTAFYDFHQLQIAFDYVWQHAIDDGILTAGQTLCGQLIDQGGDPLGQLQPGTNPVNVLRNEVRHVTTAQKTLQAAGVMFRSIGTAADITTPITIRPPPLVRPPFFNGATQIGPAILPPDPMPNDILDELTQRLSERYKFEVFAPGSTNFGLLVTYRQKWEPITYQVGKLVKTLTLAPKETRKVTSKRVIRRERAVKEMQDNQRNRKDETSDTMREEAEIVQKAQDKTSFNLTAKGSYDIGISDGDASTSLTRDAESASQETKKSFHEAVLKAAQEFRDERKLEVETKDSRETELTDSAELQNPNEELTCTYLFYELQRRFRVSEQLHRLTPVVFVAMEVPNPDKDAIDLTLLTHAWIINRVLLDDRYRAALDYLCTRVVGDELALQHLQQNVADVSAAVEDMKKSYRDMETELAAREAALQAAMEARAGDVGKSDSQGVLSSAEDWLFGGDSSTDPQAAQVLEDAAKDAYERAVREQKDLRMRLDAETAALSAATEAYAKARAEHMNQILQIAGLRAHFKENVLYYMQAIWSFTFRDQIFFSLCNVKVPKLSVANKTYDVAVPAELPVSIAPKPGQVVLEVHADVQLTPNLDPANDWITLAEVADLDAPLGFKGNYMIFPLKQSNPLTDYMMLPYIDSELGLHDPDDLGSWTAEDFAAYAQCLLQKSKSTLSDADYAALEKQLESQYEQILTSTRVTSDEIVVPTSSLYIEALPGAHALLENFKLQHRVIDVQKAAGEARKQELSNLRYAARILGADLADPEIDKKIVVANGAGIVIPPDV